MVFLGWAAHLQSILPASPTHLQTAPEGRTCCSMRPGPPVRHSLLWAMAAYHPPPCLPGSGPGATGPSLQSCLGCTLWCKEGGFVHTQ